MMTSKKEGLEKAVLLAAEIMDICFDLEKPLAADYVHSAIEYLIKGSGYDHVIYDWTYATKAPPRGN